MKIFEKYPGLNDLLWPHQIEAITQAESYIENYSRPPYMGSFLVRMPTGTGKSGVITILSNLLDSTKNVLVVTPWKTIRDQLAKDLEYRFLATIDPCNVSSIEKSRKRVSVFYPSTLGKKLNESSEDHTERIYVCTIQTLQTIFREYEQKPLGENPLYESLIREINLVIFDEGHREPAPEWARAIRNLNAPTILLTATPYRNDHKLFKIENKESVFSYSHDSAENHTFIRKVKFINDPFPRSREGFVSSLINFYNNILPEFSSHPPDNPRVIIRCQTSDEINEITHLITDAGYPAIGVHENFQDRNGLEFLRKSVPDPKTYEATFWVHQNKLIEGIDDPRFCVVAFYKPLKNGRALVQQIGRIIRNVERKSDQHAFVYTHPEDNLEEFWANYREYEAFVHSHPEYAEQSEWEYIFNNTIVQQPKFIYLEGNYRKRLSFKDEIDLYKELGYPKSVNVYIDEPKLEAQKILESIQDEWSKKDLIIRKVEWPDKNTWVVIYQKQTTSVFLTSRYYVEFQVGFTICRKSGGILFYFDSEGITPEYLLENFTNFSQTRLMKLLSSPGSIIRQVSLRNIDVGRQNIRRRVIYSTSLADTIPRLDEHAQFSTTLYGSTPIRENEFRSRYVGLTKARISDRETIKLNYEQYIEWLDQISRQLSDKDLPILSVLTRYANPIDIGRSPPKARSIMFDVYEFDDRFTYKSKNEYIKFEDTFCEIKDKKFRLVAIIDGGNQSKDYEVSINFNRKNRRYRLESKQFASDFVRLNPETNQVEDNIIAYLNRVQPFRIGFDNLEQIYSFGQFYKPHLNIFRSPGKKNLLDLLSLFTPIGILATIESEKGSVCEPDQNHWQAGCLFDVIDNYAKYPDLQELGDVDYLICDDMGTEIADFIAISERYKTITLIHAKVKSKASKYSANAFQDVCWQAIKNLGWINPYSEKVNKFLSKWESKWKSDSMIVRDRIRIGKNSTPEQIWEKFQAIIRDPRSTKNVWIMLGKGFSLHDFEEQRAKPNPRPEIVHIFYLLQSTWNIVDSTGGKLRIFCSP